MKPLQELNAIQRAERQHRLRIALIAVPLLIAVVLMLFYVFQLDIELFRRSPYDIYPDKEQREPLWALIAIGFLAASGFGALMLYLQTGFKRSSRIEGVESGVYADALKNLEKYVDDLRKTQDSDVEALRDEIKKTAHTIHLLREQQAISLTPSERTEFLSLLKEQLQSAANKDVVDDLKKQWTLDLDRESQVKLVSGHFNDAKNRLTTELEAVNRRGNINLGIGIFTTLAGMVILGATVFDTYKGDSSGYQAILLHYLPRLSLVVFIEIFAYFFLKLYKASLAETKYFQNELTNIESKFTALIVALHRPQELGASATINTLATTERNFLLKQGESTVDIEALKVENDRQKGLLSELRAFFQSRDGKPS